ncbi:MAG TPA: hypothetical protein VFV52_08015 [Bacilli bacterium]|nr:hypothetical protein [Bacilli bacterium]
MMKPITYFVTDERLSQVLKRVKDTDLFGDLISNFHVEVEVGKKVGHEVMTASIQIFDGEKRIIFLEIEDLYSNEREVRLVAACETLEGSEYRMKIPGGRLIRVNQFELSEEFETYPKQQMRAIGYFVKHLLLYGYFTSMVMDYSLLRDAPRHVQQGFYDYLFGKVLRCDGVLYWRADDPSDVIWA